MRYVLWEDDSAKIVWWQDNLFDDWTRLILEWEETTHQPPNGMFYTRRMRYHLHSWEAA